MKILLATTNIELQKIDLFFEQMWNNEFNLDASNQIEDYKKCDIYYISKNNEMVSIIIYSKHNNKNCIWRFGTLESHRWKWYWTALIKYVLEKYSWNFYLFSDEKQAYYYEKFWFRNTWEKFKIWNTYWINMVLEK